MRSSDENPNLGKILMKCYSCKIDNSQATQVKELSYNVGRSHVDVVLVPVMEIVPIMSTSTKHIMRNHIVRIFNY
jgi:hypothetical protein